MKHSRREENLARRHDILCAAEEVFGTLGYHTAIMDDICERAGISKPTVYKHFTSKLEIFLTVLQQQFDTLESSLRQALRAPASNADQILAGVRAFFDFVDGQHSGGDLVFDAGPPSEPAAQLRQLRATERCIGAVQDVVARSCDLPTDHARFFAVGLVGASRAAALHWRNFGPADRKNDAVETIADFCWGGLLHMSRIVSAEAPAVAAGGAA